MAVFFTLSRKITVEHDGKVKKQHTSVKPQHNKITLQTNPWHRQEELMNDNSNTTLDNIFIRFGTELYRQVVRIPMGTNCAPLVADLFLL